MNVRRIESRDLDKVLEIYYKIDSKAPFSTLEGWALSEVREQLSGFIDSSNYVSLCSEDDSELTAFVFCRIASARLATIEIFCKNPNCDPARNGGLAGSQCELVFAELLNELKSRGIQSVNTLVNKRFHNFRMHTKFLEFGGFTKISELVEYEIDL